MDLHREVGNEGGGRQVHLEGGLFGDGHLVPDGTLHAGDGVAGHHTRLDVVIRHLQL